MPSATARKGLLLSCWPQQSKQSTKRNYSEIKIKNDVQPMWCHEVTMPPPDRSIHKATSHSRTLTMALPDASCAWQMLSPLEDKKMIIFNISGNVTGWECNSLGRASNWHAADAGLIPRCGKGFFSQSQLSVQALLRCPYTPCAIAFINICEKVKDRESMSEFSGLWKR